MNFRKDINGLRAIAVLAVVLFHFRVTGFNGGFSGVDIFFVISGYLMTGIIFTKLEQNKFSIIEFYLHRARRIIPALAVLCIALTIFGFFYLLTPDLREVTQNIRKVMLFISNHAFYNQTGYFDTSSQENWLLHTWSLAVEWQFYLIYPLVIVGLYKLFNQKATTIIVLIMAIVSLIFSITYTPINPSAAFYFLPTRAWEMLTGGIVFLFPLPLSALLKRFTEWLGLAFILLGLLFLADDFLWPGYLALIPVVGTMLIIWSNQNSIITSNPLFQWMGKISYSVYLWHWPIVVLLFTSGLLGHPVYIIIGIIAAFILGMLSYVCIEKQVKLKYGKTVEIIKYIGIVVITISIAAIVGTLVKHYPQARQNFLFSGAFQEINNAVLNKNNDVTKQCLLGHDMPTFPECKIGEGEASIIVLGDSHAATIFSAVRKANTTGASILWAYKACPTIEGVQFVGEKRKGCIHLIEEKLALLKNAYPNVPVLFSNLLSPYLTVKKPTLYFTEKTNNIDEFKKQYREAYINTMCSIAQNRPVYVLKPIPEPKINVPKKMASMAMFNTPIVTSLLSTYQQDNKLVIEIMEEARDKCGIHLLDPIPYYCPDGKNCVASEGNRPLYHDDNHLTDYGGERLIPLFKRIFDR